MSAIPRFRGLREVLKLPDDTSAAGILAPTNHGPDVVIADNRRIVHGKLLAWLNSPAGYDEKPAFSLFEMAIRSARMVEKVA